MEAEIKYSLALMSSKVRDKNLELLQDRVSNRMVVESELLDEVDILEKWATC